MAVSRWFGGSREDSKAPLWVIPIFGQLGPYRSHLGRMWAHVGPIWAHILAQIGPIWGPMFGPTGAHIGSGANQAILLRGSAPLKNVQLE